MAQGEEKHEDQQKRPQRPREPRLGEDTGTTAETEEEPDGEEESLRRLDAWMNQEHDRFAQDMERLDEAAKPLGRIEIDSREVIDAHAMRELGRASQMEPVEIDSRIERMDDDDNVPASEYGLLVETKVRVVKGKITPQETAEMLSAGWIAVQRDQLEAVAEAVDRTRISSAQALAILMTLVGTRIGEHRMRDLMETMSQTTEVPTRQMPTRE